MRLNLTLAGNTYLVRHEKSIHLAIPVDFNGSQPNHFGAPKATAKTLEGGGFVGDTREGGSCNVSEITMVPHCNGTHTESIGHIVNQPLNVHQQLQDTLIPAVVVSVSPRSANTTDDQYLPTKQDQDKMICRQDLQQQMQDYQHEEIKALVIRTLPNDSSKCSTQYDDAHQPPFISLDAIDYLVERGVQHLLVDFPSVDKMYDEGLLTVHHRFWQVAEGSHEQLAHSKVNQTISEMVFVPDNVKDGQYLLNLQIPAFVSDAAPSRPILIPLERIV